MESFWKFLSIFNFPFQYWPGCILPDMNKVIWGKSEGTFKAGIALNFSSTQETWRNIPTIMIIPGRNDKYKWKNKSNKKWLPAWYFAENIGHCSECTMVYYTTHDQIDYSLFCNSLYFSCFGGKNMLWLSFIHNDLNFISLCSKLIIDYHTPKQRKIKFKPRIKLNHNKYPHFPKLHYRVFFKIIIHKPTKADNTNWPFILAP